MPAQRRKMKQLLLINIQQNGLSPLFLYSVAVDDPLQVIMLDNPLDYLTNT